MTNEAPADSAHFMPDSLSKILIKCMKSKAMDVPEWLTVKEMPDTFPCCFDCGDLLQSTLYCFNDLYFSDGRELFVDFSVLLPSR